MATVCTEPLQLSESETRSKLVAMFTLQVNRKQLVVLSEEITTVLSAAA